MEPFKPRGAKTKRLEKDIQQEIEQALTLKGWFVKSTHGNIYQYGFPDLYCGHIKYGTRWVEVKVLESYSFTPAQLETFPRMSAAGIGIWILTESSDWELNKLFQPPQWSTFLKW